MEQFYASALNLEQKLVAGLLSSVAIFSSLKVSPFQDPALKPKNPDQRTHANRFKKSWLLWMHYLSFELQAPRLHAHRRWGRAN